MKYPRTPYVKIDGIIYFGRMVDKIRLMAAGELHPELHENLGKGFDERCCDFLQISYDELKAAITEDFSDAQALEWCFAHGRKPSDKDREVWSEFMRKRGWNDNGTELLERRKKESGFENRAEIRTMFDYIDADEGRPVNAKPW